MKFSNELQPKAGAEKGGEMAKKLRKLVLPIAMLFGAGAGIENVSKKNAPEKIKKPAAEFMVKDENKVHKSGADTWKSEGNIGVDPAMSDESELEPIIITVPRYH